MGVFRDCSIFGYPLLSQERVSGEATNVKFCMHNCIFTGSIGLSEQKVIKNVGRSSPGRSQGLSKISGQQYTRRIGRHSSMR